jgi:hypothetical protein
MQRLSGQPHPRYFDLLLLYAAQQITTIFDLHGNASATGSEK